MRTRPRRISNVRRGLLIVGLIIIAVGAVPAYRQALFAYHLSAGKSSLNDGDFEKARSHLKRAERLQPEHAETHYRLAVVNRRTGKLDDLVRHLKKAQEYKWKREDVYRQQLLLKVQVGRFREVEHELKALIAKEISDEAALEVYEALAFGYWSNHQIDDAIKCLNFWIKWRRHDIDPRLMRAEIYDEFNDPDSAEKEYRDILKFAPDHGPTLTSLGRLLLKGGRVDESAKFFQQALRSEHETAEVYFGLAECEFRSSRPDEAERLLKKVNLEEMPPERKAKVYKLEADIAQFRQQHPRVVELLTKILEIWPHDVGLHQTLAQSYRALGKNEDAERHLALSKEITVRAEKFYNLQRQVVASPEDPELRYLLGDILAIQGLLDDAVGWWRSALRINPLHQPSHEALVKYYTAKNNQELAEKHRTQAQASVPNTFVRGWTMAHQGNLVGADQQLALIERYPSYPLHAAVLRGALLNHKQQHAEAFELAAPALTSEELKLSAMVVQAQALIGMQRLIEAEKMLVEVLAQNANAIEAHRLLSVIYYDLGAVNETVRHLQITGELDKRDSRPFRQLGLMYKDYEVFDKAIVAYQEALKRNPEMPEREEVLLELGECMILQRDYAGAQDALQQAVPTPERDALLAEAIFNLSRTEEADQMVEQILAADPDNVRAILLKGDMHLFKKEFDAAVQHMTRAAELKPYDYEVRLKYALALQRAGQLEDADRESKRAQELKDLRFRYAELQRLAIERTRDPGLRREIADLSLKLGRPDLAKVWSDAANVLESQLPPATEATTDPGTTSDPGTTTSSQEAAPN